MTNGMIKVYVIFIQIKYKIHVQLILVTLNSDKWYHMLTRSTYLMTSSLKLSTKLIRIT